MRKLKRTSTPNILRKECPSPRNRDKLSEQAYRTRLWKFKLSLNKSDFDWYGLRAVLLSKLMKMSKQHCAFCDRRLSNDEAKNGAEIEHFYPKVEYPNKAYVWTNLFPICRACNKAKLAQFNKKLVKPDTKKYNFSQYFIFNFKTGEIEPNPHSPKKIQDKAQKTIEIYKLHRDDLCKDRLDTLSFYESFRDKNDDINFYSHRDFIELGFIE